MDQQPPSNLIICFLPHHIFHLYALLDYIHGPPFWSFSWLPYRLSLLSKCPNHPCIFLQFIPHHPPKEPRLHLQLQILPLSEPWSQPENGYSQNSLFMKKQIFPDFQLHLKYKRKAENVYFPFLETRGQIH